MHQRQTILIMITQGTINEGAAKPELRRLNKPEERPIRFEAVRQDELMTPGYYLILLRQHHVSTRRKWSSSEFTSEV
jgi:hypothetical protein